MSDAAMEVLCAGMGLAWSFKVYVETCGGCGFSRESNGEDRLECGGWCLVFSRRWDCFWFRLPSLAVCCRGSLILCELPSLRYMVCRLAEELSDVH